MAVGVQRRHPWAVAGRRRLEAAFAIPEDAAGVEPDPNVARAVLGKRGGEHLAADGLARGKALENTARGIPSRQTIGVHGPVRPRDLRRNPNCAAGILERGVDAFPPQIRNSASLCEYWADTPPQGEGCAQVPHPPNYGSAQDDGELFPVI